MKPHIELYHLEAFLTVAEEMNFKRAAERLHIAQPPLSRQIQRLELDLGVKLFYRTKRQVQLTEAGRAFLEEARRILSQVEQGIRVAQRASRGELGRLVLGFEGSSACDIIPFSLKVYQERFPDVELVVQEMATGEQLLALHEERIGIGFIVPPFNDEALAVETVWREPLILALPETHSLSAQWDVPVQELRSETFITGPRNSRCGLYEQTIAICQQAGFSPRIIQEAKEMQIMLGFIAAGLGIALLPASFKHFQRPGVIYRRLQPSTPEIELAIAWRRDDPSPVLQAFLEVVREFAALVNGEQASNELLLQQRWQSHQE